MFHPIVDFFSLLFCANETCSTCCNIIFVEIKGVGWRCHHTFFYLSTAFFSIITAARWYTSNPFIMIIYISAPFYFFVSVSRITHCFFLAAFLFLRLFKRIKYLFTGTVTSFFFLSMLWEKTTNKYSTIQDSIFDAKDNPLIFFFLFARLVRALDSWMGRRPSMTCNTRWRQQSAAFLLLLLLLPESNETVKKK